jgi:nucleotide-binding universal stress UspA family protein
MFKHILIPTDGSPVSMRAAKAALRLAAQLGARVSIYHAIDDWQPQAYGEGYGISVKTLQAFERGARESGAKLLAAVAKAADAAGVRSSRLIEKARTPYEGIAAAARKSRCDLIFIGSHGRRGISKLMMGSVTQNVLAHATVPVLVYRGSGAVRLRHILVPTDGSPASLKGARAAVRFAAEVGARVTALHAIDTSQPFLFGGGYGSDARTFVDFERLARESGERQVGAVGKLARAARVPFALQVTKARTPYEGIVAAARRNRCDLIFIASHGRRGLSKLMTGSVTQKVLAHASVPAIVYR